MSGGTTWGRVERVQMGRYTWERNGLEVVVKAADPGRDTVPKDIKAEFFPKRIFVSVKGETLLTGTPGLDLDWEECYWAPGTKHRISIRQGNKSRRSSNSYQNHREAYIASKTGIETTMCKQGRGKRAPRNAHCILYMTGVVNTKDNTLQKG